MALNHEKEKLHIADIVARFGASIGLPEATLGENDRIDLEIGDVHVTMTIEGAEASLLWIGCALSDFPNDNPSAAEWLLSEAFEHWSYASMTIGIDPDAGRAQMHTTISSESLTVQELENRLSNLLESANPLREAIERLDFVENSGPSFGIDDAIIVI